MAAGTQRRPLLRSAHLYCAVLLCLSPAPIHRTAAFVPSSTPASQRTACDRPSFSLLSAVSATTTAPPSPQQQRNERQEQSNANRVSTDTTTIARRAAEVASVAILDVALPLIASAASYATTTPERQRGWDAFWSSSSSKDDAGASTSGAITNAQRVSSALEALGPTFVKFGQALSSRPDIVPPNLAGALAKLQDDMEPFDTTVAKDIVLKELLGTSVDERGERWGYEKHLGIGASLHSGRYAGDEDVVDSGNTEKDQNNNSFRIDEQSIRQLVDSLTETPIAAASVGQVYKGHLPGYGPVAVKVRRPGIEQTVDSDYALLRTVAQLIEGIPALPSTSSAASESSDGSTSSSIKADRLIATELVAAIDEFMGRLVEELDYRREERNARKFASLYAVGTGSAIADLPDVNGKGVVVPEFIPGLCTDNVIVMSWIDGTKLTEVSERAGMSRDDAQAVRENLELIELATQCTLSQLLDTGTLHADPHGGNLLKVQVEGSDPPRYRLAYLDFGIVSYVPSQVRDGLVCAVAKLVFSGDAAGVADLFGELQLIPPEVLNDPAERAALQDAMKITLDESLRYPDSVDGETAVPVLLFDKLLDALARLVPRFKFDLPPYFINNARALSTLEGIARTLDPSFNVLQVMYPTALNRMLLNPTNSRVVDDTLQSLIRSKETGRIDKTKVSDLLRDSALISGYSRRKVLSDVVRTKGGRQLIRGAISEEFRERLHVVRRRWRRGRRRGGTEAAIETGRYRTAARKKRFLSKYFKL